MNNKLKIALCSVLLGALLTVGMTACDKTDAPADTDAPTTDAPTTEAETEAEQGGCKSAMASAALVAVIALGALTLGKKKD